MYCRLNQTIINGCRNACSQFEGITFIVSFCEHSHTFVKFDEFVMGHPGQMAIRHACHIHALLTQRGHITRACLTIALEGRS